MSEETVVLERQSERVFGYLVATSGRDPGAIYQLPESSVTVGRGEDAHIRIDDPSVSATHAHVEGKGGGAWRLVDAGSANGVVVNGARTGERLLQPDDVIELGR